MGKSFQTVEWAESSRNPLTIFTSRRELYGQYEKWCEEQGLDYLVLPAFQHECETIGEDHPIEARVNELYESGISGAEIHREAQRYFGRDLPCQLDGPCRYMEKREFNPEDYDVLIGHYLQAHNRDYLEDRYVAIDEFWSLVAEYDPEYEAHAEWLDENSARLIFTEDDL